MRSLFLLLLIVCTALAQVPNQRVNTLTATTGITNNGVYKHPTGAGLGLVFTSDAAGNATWQPDTSGSLWTNDTSESSSVVYLKAFPTNFQIRPYWTNGAMLTLGPYSTNWFDTAFGDPRQYYSIISARDVSRGDVDRNNFWFSTGLDTVGNVYGSIDGSARTNFAILTIDVVGMPNGGTRRVQAGYDGTTTILNVVGETGSTLINDGRMTISTSITNLGTYQHTNGAFTGAVFLSTNNSGDAMWSTNIPNLVISNTTLFSTLISNAFINQAFITNLFTTGGSIEESLWTNTTVVLIPKTNGSHPKFATRVGNSSGGNIVVGGVSYDPDNFILNTNVGDFSFAAGSNLLARGQMSISMGLNNLVETNSTASSVLGGSNNMHAASSIFSTIAGGTENFNNGAENSFIGAGEENQLTSAASHSFLGGGRGNSISAGTAVVVGGEVHQQAGAYSFIGGGFQNWMITGTPDFSAIVGGYNNQVLASSEWSFIGGGRVNTINSADWANIPGGATNTINSGSHFAHIGGGSDNQVINSIYAIIPGGLRNRVDANHGWTLGTSNWIKDVNALFAGCIGVELTNNVTKSVDIGCNDFFKTTFYTQGTLFRTNVTNNASVTFNSHMIGTGSTTALTADNQSVTVTNRNYIRLSSDSAVAGDRTFVISSGVQDGQLLDLEWTGTNAGELVDDFAATGGGNGRLSATWTPTQYDVLSLRWNGTDWIERSRSTN